MAYTNINAANFAGNDLTQVLGLTILATNPYNPAKRSLTMADLARSNKSKVNSDFYNKRQVTVRVGITRATRALVEQSFDSLMALIQGREKDLLLNQSGGTRKYTATYADTVMRTEGGSYLEFDLIFETSDHYGYDQNDSLLLAISGFTSGNRTDQINVGGSAEWQAPKITITFTSITSGASKYVQISNDVNGQYIKVTRTWTTGDVLEIDSLNQTVKVNGAEVAFTGAFPEWNTGIGYVNYSDTFGARTLNSAMTYKKRYV